MAKYEIWNFGATRRIPWEGGKPLDLLPDSGVYTDNKELAEHAGKFSMIQVKEVKGQLVSQGDQEGIPDYEGMTWGELRKAAAKRGLWRVGSKAKELITRLREAT